MGNKGFPLPSSENSILQLKGFLLCRSRKTYYVSPRLKSLLYICVILFPSLWIAECAVRTLMSRERMRGIEAEVPPPLIYHLVDPSLLLLLLIHDRREKPLDLAFPLPFLRNCDEMRLRSSGRKQADSTRIWRGKLTGCIPSLLACLSEMLFCEVVFSYFLFLRFCQCCFLVIGGREGGERGGTPPPEVHSLFSNVRTFLEAYVLYSPP